MMNFAIDPDQIDDLAAYMMTLKRHDYAPSTAHAKVAAGGYGRGLSLSVWGGTCYSGVSSLERISGDAEY